MNNPISITSRIHWAVWFLAVIPGVLGASFLVQALHARLILGRNPITCIDGINSPSFVMHRHVAELLLLATLYGVLPLFLCTSLVRRLKRMPIRNPVLLFGSGIALCVLLVFMNPWNYVSWWLD